jgi:two-component system, NarL family, response regulator NreC
VVRTGLRLLLETQPGWKVVAESGDAETAARDVRMHHPDVLVLDLIMPGRASLEVLRELRRDAVSTVVLTMESDPAMARAALTAGASAYVLKEAADDHLLEAIRAVAAGRTYLDPTLAALASEGTRERGALGRLTARERDVLRLIALGHTNREIARELGLSVRTIESHRASIQAKTKRTSRAGLATTRSPPACSTTCDAAACCPHRADAIHGRLADPSPVRSRGAWRRRPLGLGESAADYCPIVRRPPDVHAATGT